MASFVLPIISGLAGLLGGGQQQKQTTNTSGTSNTSQNQTATSTPNLSPYQMQLAKLFTGGAQDLWKQSTNLAPYAAQGQAQIADQGNANHQVIANMLASHGLSYSPAAAAPLTQNTINSGNQMSSFLSQIPLLQHQLQTASLDQLMKAFQVLPTSVTNTGSGNSSTQSNQTGTTTTNGNPMGGLFGGLGAGLAAPSNGMGVPNITNILSMLGLGGGNVTGNSNTSGGGSGRN